VYLQAEFDGLSITKNNHKSAANHNKRDPAIHWKRLPRGRRSSACIAFMINVNVLAAKFRSSAHVLRALICRVQITELNPANRMNIMVSVAFRL